jgi:hypothetical protein
MEKRKALRDPEAAPFQDTWSLEIRPTSAETTPSSTPEAMHEDTTMNAFHSVSTEKARYIGWAYESYINSEAAKNRYVHMPVAKWLRSTLALAKADPALDTAMLAITCKMYSAFYTDQSLFLRSKYLYTSSLGLLQRNLSSEKTALSDETLAATCLIALYEVRTLRSSAITLTDRSSSQAWTKMALMHGRAI